jgi:hypothetical protein
MVTQYQSQPYQYQTIMTPPTMQPMGVQQYQPVVPMPRPQQPQPSPNVQSSYSREEIDEALKGEDDDHVDIDDNYMELLEEGGDDASVNPTTQN